MTHDARTAELSGNRIILTGATGFVGRQLVLRLLRDNVSVTALVRDIHAARAQLGDEVSLVDLKDTDKIAAALDGSYALIHLAGAPIFKRWTRAHKRRMWSSRVDLATRLTQLILEKCATPPKTIIGASGIGIYGDTKDQPVDEDTPPGDDYLSQLASAWEAAWEPARKQNLRVVTLRLGIVMGIEGGFLQKIVPLAEQGLAAVVGSGKQYLPWIHIDDLIELIVWSVVNPNARGAYNACAPTSVSHRVVLDTIAAKCQHRVHVRVPRPVLRIALGELAETICTGQNAAPKRTLADGFKFRFSQLDAALHDILSAPVVSLDPCKATPQHELYIESTQPNRQLQQVSTLDAPIDEVFSFFSNARNLSVLTPPGLQFQIETPTPIDMREGALIDYKIALGVLRFRWRTRIEHWESGHQFADVQLRGPYASWYHEHRFEALDGNRTKMTDTVYYRVGLGKLSFGIAGKLIESQFVRPQLRRIFAYRSRMIHARFGSYKAQSLENQDHSPELRA